MARLSIAVLTLFRILASMLLFRLEDTSDELLHDRMEFINSVGESDSRGLFCRHIWCDPASDQLLSKNGSSRSNLPVVGS